MTRMRVVAATLVVLVGGAVAWLLLRDDWSEREFSTCTVDDGSIVLGYEYGAGDDIRTSFKRTDDGLVVLVQARTDDGPHPAILLSGQMRIADYGNPETRVLDHAGRRITCTEPTSPPELTPR